MTPTHSHAGNWKELGDRTQVSHFSSAYGKSNQIYVRRREALVRDDSPITIFLFHDLTSYHGRFLNLIEWFQTQCPHISFVMMDFLGHGLSSGTRGHIPQFDALATDVEKLFKIVFHQFGKGDNEKWVALGHGMGALAVLDMMKRSDENIKNKIDRLVLSNFVLNFSSIPHEIEKQLLSKLAFFRETVAHVRPLEIFMAKEVLTHAKEQTAYMEDPLINRKPTYQTLKSLSEKVRHVYQDAYFLDKPTLLLKSGGQYLHDNGIESFSKGFKKELLVEKKYSNLKHDLYNEKENLLVFNDISEWVGK